MVIEGLGGPWGCYQLHNMCVNRHVFSDLKTQLVLPFKESLQVFVLGIEQQPMSGSVFAVPWQFAYFLKLELDSCGREVVKCSHD